MKTKMMREAKKIAKKNKAENRERALLANFPSMSIEKNKKILAEI